MKLIVVYFHGYGSSPASDKVNVLRERLKVPVHAFPQDIDLDVATPLIMHNIDMVLADKQHGESNVLFVGTSLGGWMASEMGAMYRIPAIVINPSCDPATSLSKYGVPQHIRSKYDRIKFSPNNTYFFAANDEVIDNSNVVTDLLRWKYDVHVDFEGDHRFNGRPFDRVIDTIKQKYL